MLRLILLTAAALGTATAPAFAHLDPAAHGSFMAGVSHPLFGADHILAMVAVGLWAALIGGRARWLVPSAFVGTMLVGFALALSGVSLPMVEPAILASVVALGLLVALAVRLPVALSAVVVGLFALFHGYAHGGELGGAGAASFAIGFALSTAVLHGAGLLLGRALGGAGLLPRLLGGATALGGLVLMVG
ncbi:protein hupE [Aureimonas ureilytica]|uniref:Protein hupE n=1 Tax=Aureimonas ureilytica TaxID=401562 RepID=A0A175RMS0_9HYPH|nr:MULTISPECIES: HupE/UreJ family protein [Aureimonas]KTR04069.1 protein hupE [Aureimonas ureilytica]